MGNLYWPLSLINEDDTEEGSRRNFSIVEFIFKELPAGTSRKEALFLGNLLYDEYLSTPAHNAERTRRPLAPIEILPVETFGKSNKMRTLMELYAVNRVAEKFPGMTWDTFLSLTPDETNWVLDIVRQITTTQNAEGAKTVSLLEAATKELR